MSEQKDTAIGQFETSLKQLEQIVEQMESGELSLEASLANFEKGVSLTRTCQQALTQAEQKIKILVEETDQLEAIDFDDEAEDEDTF